MMRDVEVLSGSKSRRIFNPHEGFVIDLGYYGRNTTLERAQWFLGRVIIIRAEEKGRLMAESPEDSDAGTESDGSSH